ncbi:hypothetical protein ACIKT0_03920 [Hansschlegelia beijingensis]|uniref:hypothetical protein n=1 Tax=Hansschlegelia beijingensis TaxID=1133344 RepID=UPI00387F14DE
MATPAKAKLAEIERRIGELTKLLIRAPDAAAEAERQDRDGTTHLRRSLVLQAAVSSLHEEADALRRAMTKTG